MSEDNGSERDVPGSDLETRSIVFKKPLLDQIDAIATEQERSRSYIVNKALEVYLSGVTCQSKKAS